MSTVNVNLSDESSSDDDDSNWQQVAVKRKRTGSPITIQHKCVLRDNVPSTSKNMFDSLRTEDKGDENNEHQQIEPEVPKPPPIFIPDVDDVEKMVNDLCKVIDKKEFSFKSLNDGQIRLVIKSVDCYRNIIKYLESKNKSFHTFQLKQERAFRCVIKGLHHSTPIADIKAQLLMLGHQVRSIRNIISRRTKYPLPMFFVDLDPNPNNHTIFNIKSIESAIVEVVPPKHFDDIVQCHRCQEFGHTKSYCKKSFKCVKCGLDHPTAECTKTREEPPKCVNCKEAHAASYRGCVVYQNIARKRVNGDNRKHFVTSNNNYTNNLDFQNYQTNANMSYSQAVKASDPSQNSLLQKIESMLNKQIELTNTLINMMSMIMNKLCN